jgi:hypothetical protein
MMLLGTPLLMMGCFDFEHHKSTAGLCQENPQLRCDELNINDGQCRIPRTDLIWHRLEVYKNPNDVNKIKEYTLTQQYKKCLEVAAQIQPFDQTELKRRRYNALINAEKNMMRLEKELETFHTPNALYFLWSQTGNQQARRAFLQMEGKPALATAEMQYALATFYIHKDSDKTIKLLNRALELSDPKTLNVNILESLASLNQLKKRKEVSYIWAMVSKHFGAQIASERELQIMYAFDNNKIAKLDQIADIVIDAIVDKRYRAELIPERLKNNE